MTILAHFVITLARLHITFAGFGSTLWNAKYAKIAREKPLTTLHALKGYERK